MNFFAHQDRARRRTWQLVLLFLLAVVGILVGVDAVLLLVLGARRPVGVPSGGLIADNAGLLTIASAAVLGTIALATLVRMAQLSQGGGRVAEMLGGARVSPDTRDPLRRRLLNVVEEMAIASGAPVPSVYVLEGEEGINAFAAGYNPADAAIAVTRGTLETLDRAELQGVIAHEFSHVVNGDTRINTRLMGVLFGILVLTVIGRIVLYGTRFRSRGRDQQAAAAIMFAALALIVLGYIGVLFGRLIQAAVSRQRESLADASAVQFTRHPEGIAGALKKIAAVAEGSALASPRTEEVSHMLLGPGLRSMSSLFATHPPLLERIQAIEPQFDADALERFIAHWQRQQTTLQERAAAREEASRGRPALELPGLGGTLEKVGGGAGAGVGGMVGATAAGVSPAAVTALLLADLDRPGRAASEATAQRLASLPKPLYEAVRTEGEAASAVFYLLLDADPAIRERQIGAVEQGLGEAAAAPLREWSAAPLQLAPEQRLPLLELALPTLRQQGRARLQRIQELVFTLVRADDAVSVFEYAVATLFRARLRDVLDPAGARVGGHRSLRASRSAAQTVLSVLARAGVDEDTAAARAYEAGVAALQLADPPPYAFPARWVDALEDALQQLDGLRPRELEVLVGALGATVTHDRKVTLQEVELLRALCGALHCPVPPLFEDLQAEQAPESAPAG